MKKIIYLIALLAVGITACTEDFNDGVADPQSNKEEDTQATAFTVALGDDLTGNVILGDYDVANDTIRAIKVTAKPKMKAGTKLTYGIDVSASDKFENYLTLPADADGDNALLAVTDLNEAVKTLFGKEPVERSVYVRSYVYINENTSAVRYNTNTPDPAKITPATRIIERAYYLAINIDNITVNDLIPFKHSDQDRYVDPVFTVTLEVPANSELMIVPQSAYDMGANFRMGQIWGAETDRTTEYEGELVTYDAGSILIEEKTWVRVTLNMEDYTYAVELLNVSPYLYVPGNHQGWAPATAPQLYSKDMDMIYTGNVWLDGGYKFTAQPDWNPVNYGDGGNGKLELNGGDFNAFPGFYFIKLDISGLTYEITEASWGIVGDATSGGWDDKTPMTYDQASNTWSVTLDLKAGSFKFRANDDWDLTNMGGTTDKLVEGGDNIAITSAGNYTITATIGNSENSKFTIRQN